MTRRRTRTGRSEEICSLLGEAVMKGSRTDMAVVFNYVRAELNNRFATSKFKRARKTALSSKICAGEYPATVMPIIREIQKSGVESLWAIAHALNARGVRGARGGKWYATTVRKFLERNKVAATCNCPIE
jgi:Recombinase